MEGALEHLEIWVRKAQYSVHRVWVDSGESWGPECQQNPEASDGVRTVGNLISAIGITFWQTISLHFVRL